MLRKLIIFIILLVGFLLISELALRYRDGYLLSQTHLNKIPDYQHLDGRKLINKFYFEENPQVFARWPQNIEFFDPREEFDTETTDLPFLFKRNFIDGKSWSSNSWGFRGKEFANQKSNEVIRIVCLGSSTTEGSQDNDSTYPSFLEKKLQELVTEKRIEVINAGHSGMDSLSLAKLLEYRVLPLKPDLIVYYEMGNGINQLNQVTIHEPYNLTYFLNQRSLLFRLLTEKYQVILPVPDYRYDTEADYPSMQVYLKGIKEIIELTNKADVELMLVTPVSGFHESLWTESQIPDNLYWMYKIWYPLTPIDAQKWYNLTGEYLKETAIQASVPILDIRDEFPNKENYFAHHGNKLDPSHFSPEGNELLAGKIAGFIVENRLIN